MSQLILDGLRAYSLDFLVILLTSQTFHEITLSSKEPTTTIKHVLNLSMAEYDLHRQVTAVERAKNVVVFVYYELTLLITHL